MPPMIETQALVSFAILGWSAQPGKTPIEYTSLAFLALLGITGEARVCISIGSGKAVWKELWEQTLYLLACFNI